MGTYTERTFAEIKQDIADRLNDSLMVFWTEAELGFLCNESLRVYQTLTGYWRARVNVATTANQAFYQQMLVNVTDAAVMTEILYHLVEVPTIPYAGTDMFQAVDFPLTMQRRRAQFLSESNLYFQHSLIANTELTTDTMQLNQDTFAIARLAWLAGNVTYTNLWPASQYSLNNLRIRTGSTPQAYAWDLRAPRIIEFAPPVTIAPLDNVEIIGAFAFDDIDPSDPQPLQVPNDFCWVVKYGALADLLKSDGQARDPKRAEYCEQRYQMGVQIAQAYRKVIRVTMQGCRFAPVKFNDLDTRRPGWQNTPAQPDVAACEGGLLVFANIPDGVYSIETDQIDETPVMVNAFDNIQIDQSNYDAIIGYAVHAAMFKVGGAEFEATMPLLQNMMALASENVIKVAA